MGGGNNAEFHNNNSRCTLCLNAEIALDVDCNFDEDRNLLEEVVDSLERIQHIVEVDWENNSL